MKTPDRIWLQPTTDPYDRGGEWTWCWHEVGEGDIPDVEYVRADSLHRNCKVAPCFDCRASDPVAHQEAERIAREIIGRDDLSWAGWYQLAPAYLDLLAQLREAEKRFGVLSDEFQQSDSDQWAANFIRYSTLAGFADALIAAARRAATPTEEGRNG